MKYLIIALIALAVVWGGYKLAVSKTEDNKTEGEAAMMDYEEVSDDNSLETIETELNDTELEDFEAELDAMDKDINQL